MPPRQKSLLRDAYTRRVIQQTLKWLNGISEHNHVEDECTPDFSCCYPELFDKDRERRILAYKRLLENLDITINNAPPSQTSQSNNT